MAPSFAHRVVAIGGEIEFGESWQAALVRKFHEELGIGISIVKAMS
ncbi:MULTISPECIES: NUDIX domain-containing protein [unclassified Bradyrhizobium]|jgi:ADP-ribose pyrophosphatase YjhB (NUDIX family)|nr:MULTISPECIES: NUDIX domain-containing protein [unclassified Bradyrhizobium]